MRTTYHAAAVVGCRVDRSKVFILEDVRLCSHPLPSMETQRLRMDVNFCPICGKKLWSKEYKSIPQYDFVDETICGLRVVSNEYNDEVYIAAEVAEIDTHLDYDGKSISPHGIDTTVRERIKAILEPIGLWNEEEFGIWVVMWCS